MTALFAYAMSDHLSRAHQLLASGQLDEARIYLEELLRQDPDNTDLLYNQGPLLRGPRPARSGSRAAAPLPRARSRPLARLRSPGARLPASGRPLAGQGVHHAGSCRRSQESRGPQEPGRHPRQGRRQPAGSLLSAPLLGDRSPGPADRVRPRLRLYGAGRFPVVSSSLCAYSVNSVSSVVETSLATGYNQWFTDYHHRDTERTEDSQRT